MNLDAHREIEYVEISSTGSESRLAQIAIETEVALSINGEIWLGFRCSPDHLEELALGFLFNESFIDSPDEISSIRVCDEGKNIDVWLTHACEKPAYWTRSSGCQGGMSSGVPKVQKVRKQVEPYKLSDVQNQIKNFISMLNQMGELRSGVHTTILMDEGETISISNEIGRHNTLDKIAGEILNQKFTLVKPTLFTTGRISSDMVLKAARMGVSLLISLHSVSSQAIEAGAELGICLIGNARSSKLRVYTHPEMVKP